jgi:hypothetical protein
MPFYKTTFFFEAFQQSAGFDPGSAVGWTETWYQQSATIDSALTSADVFRYVSFRRACLATGYKIQWLRVSQVDNPRLTKIRSLGQSLGTAKGDAAQVNCCILVDVTALPNGTDTLTHHRRFLMRGLPVDVINQNVISRTGLNWGAFTRFFEHIGLHETGTALAGPIDRSAWLIRGLPSTVVRSQMSTLAATAAGNQISVASAGLTNTLGQRVLLRGVKFPYFINRVWTDVGAGIGAGERLLAKSRKHIAGTWDGSGSLTPLNYVYIGGSQYVLIGLRNRETGRPSHLTRGRRNPVL